jgi:hypothetical protein
MNLLIFIQSNTLAEVFNPSVKTTQRIKAVVLSVLTPIAGRDAPARKD